jgi:hypothetical protein
MSDVTRRKTTRQFSLDPEDETFRAMRLRKPYGEQMFRPTSVTEVLNEQTPTERFMPVGYSVTLRGPIVTSKGLDHASNYGERTYGNHDDLDQIPEEIEGLLHGPVFLRGLFLRGPMER